MTQEVMMKAVTHSKYGAASVLKLKDVDIPKPNNKEVLIKVHATSVTAGDWKARQADPFVLRLMFGLFKPRIGILGFEFSGEIESIGENVNQFKVGDEVFGTTLDGGANAQFIKIPEDGVLAIKPQNMSHTEAAAGSSSAIVALQALSKANIRKDQSVLIYGASGSIGTYAIQIAKELGANVTGVCSTFNLAMIKKLGADKVVDYTNEDYSMDKEKYDVVFDAVGKTSFKICKSSLKRKGIYFTSWPTKRIFFNIFMTSITRGKKAKLMTDKPSVKSLQIVKTLFESNKIKPVIDKCYPIEQIVEAHRYAEKGHKKGNVVITLENLSNI